MELELQRDGFVAFLPNAFSDGAELFAIHPLTLGCLGTHASFTHLGGGACANRSRADHGWRLGLLLHRLELVELRRGSLSLSAFSRSVCGRVLRGDLSR